jgi:hypothetical protein
VRQLGAYIRLLFDGWVGRISTFITLLSLFASLIPENTSPQVSAILSILPNEFYILILFLSFGLANFQIYRKFDKNSDLGFDVMETPQAHLKGEIIKFDGNNVSIEPTFVVQFNILVHLSNSGSATSVKLFIASVEPTCLQAGVSASRIEVSLRRQKAANYQAEPLYNPHHLQADEMISGLRVIADIPFNTECIEKTLGSLSSFKKMKVVLGAERTGEKPMLKSIDCEMTNTHKSINDLVVNRLQHAQTSRLSAEQVLQVYRRYMGGD